jgi:hypothetical protein
VITLWDVYFYANHTTSLSLLSEEECKILLFTHILADWFKQINGLFFSTADPGLIYVHGIDYEVLCGPWNRESNQGSLESTFTFRGDSRWLGVDKVCVISLSGVLSRN